MNYVSPTPEMAVGYMRPMFERLKAQGVSPKTMLDVGAAHGHFSGYFERFFPDTAIVAVECNERDAYFLGQKRWDVHYACLGDMPCTKTFYLNKDDPVGGGSSLYKENTEHFNNCEQVQKEITTLDTLFPTETFDFIKIDTQGSELDIMRGGTNVISRASWLLLELSFQEYNIGAPLIDDVLQYTRDLGWRMYDTTGPTDGGHVVGNHKVQVDVLFKHG